MISNPIDLTGDTIINPSIPPINAVLVPNTPPINAVFATEIPPVNAAAAPDIRHAYEKLDLTGHDTVIVRVAPILCPLTKKPFVDPIFNRVCLHVYERSAWNKAKQDMQAQLYKYPSRRSILKRMTRCPQSGCKEPIHAPLQAAGPGLKADIAAQSARHEEMQRARSRDAILIE
jgi:hypothetical protein